MKFKNILVVLNPENEKQYALARAVRLVKEQKNETNSLILEVTNFSCSKVVSNTSLNEE